MRIAYAGLRRKEEFKALAEKLGFTPLLFPVQATEKVPVPEYRDQVRELAQGVDLFLATTGVGVRDRLEAGKALGLDLEGPLAKAFRLARGAQAPRALTEAGLPPHAVGDGTSTGLLPLLPQGRGVADLQGILRLEEAVLRGEVDALAFVAAIQVEFLFEGAKDPKALREALNTRVKALAVGRVTADALREWGVKPFYVDETERLGSLLQGFKRALQKEVA